MKTRALRANGVNPREIGHFRLCGRLEEGSVGVTCLAESPPPDSRRVCLRLIRGGLAEGIVEQFGQRRQALATVDHPVLVRTRSAAVDGQGRPFFVLDAVEGQGIEGYCAHRRLDLGRRIALFRQACEGIAHAHARGLAHGALEPSDFIVSEQVEFARVRVLGLGVFDALTDRGRSRVGYRIREGLEYRSPEQVLADRPVAEPAADVYALGVILYRLLVGALPHEAVTLERARAMGMLAWTYDDGPPGLLVRASLLGERADAVARERRLTPAQLQDVLGGRLDGIVQRALAPDPAQRFPDAGALVEELRTLA